MKLIKYALGAVAGVAAGFAAGVMLAPRSGAESRAMASDAVNDAWDSAVDTYERGQQAMSERFSAMRPNADADNNSDELRAKVDLARERMDQLRDSLSNVAEPAEEAVEAEDAVEADADSIVLEVVEAEEDAAEADAEEDEE